MSEKTKKCKKDLKINKNLKKMSKKYKNVKEDAPLYATRYLLLCVLGFLVFRSDRNFHYCPFQPARD